MTRVLVVEDDPDIAEALSIQLGKAGYEVSVAGSGPAGWRTLVAVRPDALLLDLSLPGMSGQQLLRRLRDDGSELAVLAVTADSSTATLVSVLELGADDYIIKTCSMRELRSRVKAVLRRSRMTGGEQAADEPLTHDGLQIDPAKRTCERDGEPVKLTFFEFEILLALARSPGRVFSRAELLEHVLGDSEYRDQRTIDVHIRHLREKLEADPANPQLILTERRVGYRFQED